MRDEICHTLQAVQHTCTYFVLADDCLTKEIQSIVQIGDTKRHSYLEEESDSSPRERCMGRIVLNYIITDFSKLVNAIGKFSKHIAKDHGLAKFSRYCQLTSDIVFLVFLD